MNIRYPGSLAVLLLAPLLLAAGSLQAAENRLNIVTTIKPLQLLVQAVVGADQPVDVLLDPRMSPHDYQMRPSDRSKLDRADVVFWVGPDMEVFMVPVLASLDPHKKVVALQHEIAAAGDPHIWMDPLLAVAMGHKVAEVLGRLTPADASRLSANAARLEKLLVDQDRLLQTQMRGIEHPRGYLVAHDAYGRFEARYGLQHRAALTDNADLPPSARHVAQIEAALGAGEIGCVMREPAAPPKILQTLLKKRQLRVETVDAMAQDIPPGDRGIVDFYRQLGIAVGNCLRP